jgi:tetratricopeptide (TPR) repeat protein
MKRFVRAGVYCAFFSVVISSSAALAQSPPSSAGNAAFAAGNFDAAAAAYAAALTKNPDDPDAELGIGTVELYRNHLDPARAHLQQALTLAPNSPRARARLDAIEKRTGGLPFTAASVTIGNFTLHDLPGIYVPSGGLDGVFPFAVAGRISHKFFRHTALTLDFSTMTLVLEPAQA